MWNLQILHCSVQGFDGLTIHLINIGQLDLLKLMLGKIVLSLSLDKWFEAKSVSTQRCSFIVFLNVKTFQ